MYLSEMFVEDVLKEQSKLKALLAAGKLGAKSVARAGKAGLFKSRKNYFAGIEKGSNEIIRKKRIRVSHFPDAEFATNKKLQVGQKLTDLNNSHAVINKTKSVIHIPDHKDLIGKDKDLASLVKRHEIDEVRAGQKQIKKSGEFTTTTTSRDQHLSNHILKNEREITNTANSLYGKKDGRQRINKFRKNINRRDNYAISRIKRSAINNRKDLINLPDKYRPTAIELHKYLKSNKFLSKRSKKFHIRSKIDFMKKHPYKKEEN